MTDELGHPVASLAFVVVVADDFFWNRRRIFVAREHAIGGKPRAFFLGDRLWASAWAAVPPRHCLRPS